MLCTRMQLVERRFSMPRDSTEGVHKTSSALSTSLPSNIVQRPCVIRNLSSNCGSDITPRLVDRQTKKDKIKPPLVVLSLKMQPGIKTLAQRDIKRDPRKLPSYCEHYKQIRRDHPNNNQMKKTDLIVRGVEIFGENNNSQQNQQSSSSTSDIDDDCNDFFTMNDLKIELTECCQCIRDVNLMRELPNPEQLFNNDLNRKYLSVNGQDYSFHNKPYLTSRRRTSSPRTRQVIRITVNNKKLET